MAQSDQVSDSAAQGTVSESETNRKLFVGGLSWQTTEDGLQHYFESMGMDVERVLIMRDKVTGRSRGFGFAILKNPDLLDKAVSSSLHLDDRRIEAKRAIPKREMEKTMKKLFVGGIPISLNNAEFKKYFEQFGAVTESQVMTERETGRSRGFGFVTFHEEETAERVLATQHAIQGKPVEVKRAEPKKVERQPRPIIVAPVSMPGMYFPGYPYQIAYNPLYGQALAYDPNSAGYFMAPHGAVYAPQFVPIDDSMYETQMSPLHYEEIPAPVPAPPARSSRRAVVAGPKRTVLDSDGRSERAWSASLVPVDIPSISLVERVRVAQNEVRKKRGMSQPEPERSRRSAGPTMPSRRSVVTTSSSRRSRRSGVHASSSAGAGATATAAPSATTSTTSPSASSATTTSTLSTNNSSTKEGHGVLHKYFQ